MAAAPKELRSHAAQNIPRLLAQARAAELTDDQTAYVLGTIERESGFGAAMIEQHPRNYEDRTDLGNVHPGDGRRFIGRGFVQITGRTNYAYWGKRLKVELVRHPELATDPDVAAAIAVRGMRAGTFTGKRLDDYVNEDGVDYVNARRIINGTDRASLIASYADRYRAAIRACRAEGRPAVPSPDGHPSKSNP